MPWFQLLLEIQKVENLEVASMSICTKQFVARKDRQPKDKQVTEERNDDCVFLRHRLAAHAINFHQSEQVPAMTHQCWSRAILNNFLAVEMQASISFNCIYKQFIWATLFPDLGK